MIEQTSHVCVARYPRGVLIATSTPEPAEPQTPEPADPMKNPPGGMVPPDSYARPGDQISPSGSVPPNEPAAVEARVPGANPAPAPGFPPQQATPTDGQIPHYGHVPPAGLVAPSGSPVLVPGSASVPAPIAAPAQVPATAAPPAPTAAPTQMGAATPAPMPTPVLAPTAAFVPAAPEDFAGNSPTAKRPASRSRLGWIITVALLSIGLVIAAVFLVITFLELDQASGKIDEQKGTIEEQNKKIDEQKELIDKKESFGAAMNGLVGARNKFNGTKLGDRIPQNYHQSLAENGYEHRWDAEMMDETIEDVNSASAELEQVYAVAQEQKATNATGSAYETAIDQLGAGLVTVQFDDAAGLCGGEAIGCVSSEDPTIVHIDAKAESSSPYMTDWLRTGVAYHEYAHVLQFTNYEATIEPLQAFGDDYEHMADCFALTYLDGWTLDHTIWINDYQYYEVSLGYGYTCNESQRQVIRDWYDSLTITNGPLTQ